MSDAALERFLTRGEPRWSRLEILLDRIENQPAGSFGREEVQELVRLYRLAASDLNQVHSLTADPAVLGRLNALTGRAYRWIYRAAPVRGEQLRELRRFLLVEVPTSFRTHGRTMLLAAGLFLAGAVTGLVAVVVNPGAAAELTPAQFYSESPRDRVAEIEASEERIGNVEQAAAFGAELYTHNIRVAFLAFSLAALTLVGGAWILGYNGLILGAVAGSYLVEGEGVFFAAWVGPHGALELPAIVFAGAAGFVLGRAFWLPGDLTRGEALRRAFPDAWRLLVGVSLVLVVAGLVEGSFSQFSAKTVPYGLKIAVAVALGAGLMVLLFGRSGPRRDALTPAREEP